MPRVERLTALHEKLKKANSKYLPPTSSKVSVLVGFTAAYALFVHENVEMKGRGQPRRKPSKGNYWDPPGRGQAKFLEEPARVLSRELVEIAYKVLKQGKTLLQALLIAGLRLQREAQLRVPVDTGALKASAFTRPDDKSQ